VHEIPGGRRIRVQFASFLYVLRHAQEFDVILCQAVLRGAFSGTLAGALTDTPVITYMGVSPVEYFRGRRARRQVGPMKAWAGEAVIRFLMTVNGKLAKNVYALMTPCGRLEAMSEQFLRIVQNLGQARAQALRSHVYAVLGWSLKKALSDWAAAPQDVSRALPNLAGEEA
jgi:hypothetical protein